VKILVANRGEIAVRILRACRELGHASVAIYSDADQDALHTRYADEAVRIGPANAAQSYLNINRVLEAALKVGADAIHPGYGFLSENSEFAEAVEMEGLIFIGPRPDTIALTGDKLAARRIARAAGLPVLPGPDQPITDEIPAELADSVQYPVLIKAVSGGGGRGIRLAHNLHEMERMVQAARKEAQAAFGDDTVYLEPLVRKARHIEVQILGDGKGNTLCFGERECSIQRRRQKLIEEAPAPGLHPVLRHRLYDAALKLARKLNYRSLGTIEFLLDDKGHFYFIEVNPRIQVEHPVTEMVTNIDLVTAQIRLATEQKLPYRQDQIAARGWAIEARVLAEDPEQGFLPATGEITYMHQPSGPGVRLDSALFMGAPVSVDYDSLLAKVIVWGEDRERAIARLQQALREFQINGIPTTLDFIAQIVNSESFRDGRTDTTYLDTFQPERNEDEGVLIEKEVAVSAALLVHNHSENQNGGPKQPEMNMWQMAAWREQMGI